MSIFSWDYCQRHSDHLLSSGLAALISSDYVMPLEVSEIGAGVYLMTLSGNPVYIGEAKNLRSRLKQQFTPKTSTFYKNYSQSHDGSPPEPIAAFKLQILRTSIGRKELEEFGIVNLATPLNRFHRDKRRRVDMSDAAISDWDAVQSNSSYILNDGDSILHAQPTARWASSTPVEKPGMYLVYNPDETLIYIGESSNIQERHMTHSGRTYFSALRRNIGRDIFGFEYVPGKKKQFHPEHDAQVSSFLNSCLMSSMAIEFGRLELEEHLIQRLQPVLNRKSR